MKACHLTSVHPALDTRIFYKECKSLADSGWEVTLIAKNESEEVKEGVRILPFTQFNSRLKRILFSPFKMFTAAKKQKAGIYHFHDPELLITGLLLRLFTRSKVIYDIHEDYSKTLFDSEWMKFKVLGYMVSKIFYYFERMACRVMSANVVVLPNWIKKYPKAVLVRNYPILEEIKGKKEENLFVYVGIMGVERSALEMPLIFMELAKLMPGITFKMVGIFWEKKTEAPVMKTIEGCPNITFLGFRPFPEVKKILSKAKYGFVLYSSIKYLENIPVKMYEYLANEVIPIFSSFGDFRYEIEDEGWGIGVNPKNPGEAAKKIYEIITDKEKLRTIEENVKRYRTKYSWESEKKELLNLYNSLSQ